MIENILFNAGIYIRLSREDEDKVIESESIKNQRDYILDYVNKYGYKVIDEYVDDGYSGTIFDRPAFNRLIKDIESGKINMVITKDMSRLGRDYINSGYYIEKYFPENKIRYIAINDNIDTFIDTTGNEMMPFKAVINDLYAKDISKKVKSSINTKKKLGLFLGPRAPYGYIKDSNNKYKLIIDKESSEVVKKIYDLFINGYSIRNIAEELSKHNILKPSVYKNMKYKYTDKTKYIWDESTIQDILKNPNYTGDLVQNRRKKINYKSKKIVYTTNSEWIVVENTHQAIIDKQTFRLVTDIFKNNKCNNNKRNILLQGFIYCSECGHTIGINTSKDNLRKYTVCNHYRKYSKHNFCTPHSMRYEYIENIVLEEIKNIL